jgi:hypothetical protein
MWDRKEMLAMLNDSRDTSRKALLVGAALSLLLPLGAQARDDHLRFPIADALATPDAQAKVNPNIKLFWGPQQHPKAQQVVGSITSNKKTNAFNKTDKGACDWTFLSAVLALQEAAVKDGANAVVEIHSVYKNEDVASDTEYVCGAGSLMSGVALRGTIVKLP